MSTLAPILSLAALLTTSAPPSTSLPVLFEPNVGQAAPDVEFVARAGEEAILIGRDGAVMARSRGAGEPLGALRLEFVAGRASAIEGAAPRDSYATYFRSPAATALRAPHFDAARATEVWPGIDVRFHGATGAFEYDVEVAPFADPAAARLCYPHASLPVLRDDGALVLRLGATTFVQQPPIAWQEGRAGRESIAVAFDVRDDGSVGFALGAYDASRSLVIDPVVGYATYFGGNGNDSISDLVVDPATGDLILAGNTQSLNFPLAAALQGSLAGTTDAFVARFDPTGSVLRFATYLGGGAGGGDDFCRGLALDAAGNIVIGGQTNASDFPVTGNAYQPLPGGSQDAFLAVLDPTGQVLVYSTYLGGAADDVAEGVTASGQTVALAGRTSSTDFPIFAAHQSTSAGGTDAFLAAFDVTGAPRFATYLGSPQYDGASDLAIGPGSGAIYVTGRTDGEAGFPVTPGAYLPYGKAFVTRFDAGGALTASTLFPSIPAAIALDSNEAPCVVGANTEGSIQTTVGAWMKVVSGSQGVSSSTDVYVVKLEADLEGLAFGTYYGTASAGESALDVAFGPGDEPFVAYRAAHNFSPYPISGAMVHLNAQGTRVVSTINLGTPAKTIQAIAVAAPGVIHVAGATGSSFGATPSAFQIGNAGLDDGFLVRIEEADASSILGVDPIPARVKHGTSGIAWLTLDGPAPAGGAVVALASSHAALLVPAQVVVPTGVASLGVPFATKLVPAAVDALLTATFAGTTASASIRVWHGPFYSIEEIEMKAKGYELDLGDMNANGMLCGTHPTGVQVPDYQGFRWSEITGFQDLGSDDPVGINDAGALAVNGTSQSFYWPAQGGKLQIPLLAGKVGSQASAINAAGQICGTMQNSNGYDAGFRFTPGGGVINLGQLASGNAVTRPHDINDFGSVVGQAQNPSFQYVPFRWTAATGIQNLGIPAGGGSATAYGTNDLEQVVGAVDFVFGTESDMWRWAPGQGFTILGRLPGFRRGIPVDINDAGMTVGASLTWGNDPFAVFHTDMDGMLAIDDAVDPFEGWNHHVTWARAATDAGLIAAESEVNAGVTDGISYEQALLRLHPIGPQATVYGLGHPGTLGVPSLTATARPAPCATVGIAIGNSRGAATQALLVIGASKLGAPLPHGGTLLAAPQIVLPLVLPAGGTTLSGTLPCDGALFGARAYFQVLESDPGAAGGFSASAGLELAID
jgi:probable HAF family extracellular repeat protein